MLVSQDITVKADTGGQTAVSEYALSWDGHTELGYQIAGPGGRTEGLMTLEECSEAGAKFDCSAFTSMVYRHFGIEIPAQSEAQKAAAKQIFYNEEDAVPGDIAWWYGHVAIYIGDGKVMHTNTHRPPTNYPHVSTFAGEGANYRTPDAYLRMVDDVSELGEAGSTTEEDVENAVGYGSMITESDLTGMPIKSTLIDEQQRIELKDRSSLSSYDIDNNACLMIKCERNHLEKLKEELNSRKDIVASKVIVYDENIVDNIENPVKIEKVDYLKTFTDFIVEKLGNSDIINDELGEICK